MGGGSWYRTINLRAKGVARAARAAPLPDRSQLQMDVLAAFVAAAGSVQDAVEIVAFGELREAPPRRPPGAVGSLPRSSYPRGESIRTPGRPESRAVTLRHRSVSCYFHSYVERVALLLQTPHAAIEQPVGGHGCARLVAPARTMPGTANSCCPSSGPRSSRLSCRHW
jgi:hypothetical protein